MVVVSNSSLLFMVLQSYINSGLPENGQKINEYLDRQLSDWWVISYEHFITKKSFLVDTYLVKLYVSKM